MILKMLRVLTLAAAGLLVASCGTKPLTPLRTVPIKLDAANKTTETKIKLRDLIVVTLPVGPPRATWQISFHDSRFLKLMSDIAPGTGETGATTSFLAINTTSRTRIRFLLLPSFNGREGAPIDQQELVLAIQ